MRMTSENLHNVKIHFQEKTGVALLSRHQPARRTILLTAVVVCCALLAAFTIPLFTPLNGDALTLQGTYLGDGVVSVSVMNDSDRTLKFQKKLKLVSWTTGEEIPSQEGTPIFENTVFPPHSTGTMRIDLSAAYDVDALESTIPGRPKEVYYYLLLTNRDFLFGHDWMCSFSFGNPKAKVCAEAEEARSSSETAHTINAIENDLRFYFCDAYGDTLPAFNEANFTYQQKVQELLLRTEGTLVRPVDPGLLVAHPVSGVLFDDQIPPEQQHRLVGQGYRSLDGYSRIVGTEFSGSGSDYALQLSGILPQQAGDTDGGVAIPLIYLFVYDTAAVGTDGAYAFIYGQILPFSRLESCKVFEDEQYTVYNATEFFYTDLDAYLDYFLTTRSDLFCNAQIRNRIQAVYDFYMNPENLSFRYVTSP